MRENGNIKVINMNMKNYLIFLLIPLFMASYIGCSKKNESKRTGRKGGGVAVIPIGETSIEKPVINVYLENSGSMVGYINGATDFKHSVHNYLTDIKIADIANEVNLYYINSTIISQGNDVPHFFNQLKPSTFLVGNTGTSDISDMLDIVLSKTKKDTVSVLISDFIFSPGSQQNAQDFLADQQITIKNNMAKKLKEQDLAIIIYQLTSGFKGQFFDKNNNSTNIDDRRPFYIWVIGNMEHVTNLKSKVPDHKFIGSGIENSYTILPTIHDVDYEILLNPRYGEFKKDKNDPKKRIYRLSKANKGKFGGEFMFSIGANLTELHALLGDDYIKDTTNYIIYRDNKKTQDFNLNILPGTIAKYPYNVRISTQKTPIPTGDIDIALINKIPQWVYDMNDEIGLNIHADGAMAKTFGLKYLIRGVYEAYESLGDENYMKIGITLKK